MKMPAPMMPPTTTMVASKGPRARFRLMSARMLTPACGPGLLPSLFLPKFDVDDCLKVAVRLLAKHLWSVRKL